MFAIICKFYLHLRRNFALLKIVRPFREKRPNRCLSRAAASCLNVPNLSKSISLMCEMVSHRHIKPFVNSILRRSLLKFLFCSQYYQPVALESYRLLL